MYDQIIRRFAVDGKVASNKLTTVRLTYEHVIKLQMRAEGYLPILDLEPSWWVKYLPAEDLYEVRYADQGIYYGKEDIHSWEGWHTEQLIPTTKTQSKTLSPPSDSM